MNKVRTSFCIHPTAIEQLKEICAKERRSQANMLEMLIYNAHNMLTKPTEQPTSATFE